MNLNFYRTAAVLALAAGVSMVGCSKKETVKPDPTPVAELAPTPVPELPTPEPTPAPNSYIVQPADNLWRISGDDAVLGDNFLWPLLFKANRDQIIDPDLIEPAQDLTWKPAYEKAEMDDAVKKAQDTPAYVPHDKPRKQLPLKY